MRWLAPSACLIPGLHRLVIHHAVVSCRGCEKCKTYSRFGTATARVLQVCSFQAQQSRSPPVLGVRCTPDQRSAATVAAATTAGEWVIVVGIEANSNLSLGLPQECLQCVNASRETSEHRGSPPCVSPVGAVLYLAARGYEWNVVRPGRVHSPRTDDAQPSVLNELHVQHYLAGIVSKSTQFNSRRTSISALHLASQTGISAVELFDRLWPWAWIDVREAFLRNLWRR